MGNASSLYNNEAIASTALAYCFNELKTVEYSKAFLILPFILHEPTARRLRGQTNKRSLEEFIVKAPECFITFNARYQDFLILTINSITILYEANVISIKNDAIYFNHLANYSPFKSRSNSKRAEDIQKALDSLCILFKTEPTSSFYLKLKVQL